MVPSNVLVLVDRSESMELRDAYIDQNRATKLAAALKLTGVDDLRDSTRLKLAERAIAGGLADQLSANGDRFVKVEGFTSQILSDAQPSTQPTTQPDGQDGSAFDKSSTAIGAAIRQAISAYRGQPLAGILLVTDG